MSPRANGIFDSPKVENKTTRREKMIRDLIATLATVETIDLENESFS